MSVPVHDAVLAAALPSALRSAWARDGVLVFRDFLSPGRCAALRDRAAALDEALRASSPAVAFETERQAHADSEHFAGSGGDIRRFVEATDERLTNKLGHALHDLDPLFSAVSRDPRLAALSAALGQSVPLLVQSMYIFKPARAGGAVGVHQDATFLRTDPPSVIGFWFALHDADRDNGCLWALPGAHREAGPRAVFGGPPGALALRVTDARPWPIGDAVPLEVSAGSLVVLHGQLPHLSHENRTRRPREAYTLHVCDGAARWSPDSWLRRADPFRGY